MKLSFQTLPLYLLFILLMGSACGENANHYNKAIDDARHAVDTLQNAQNVPGIQMAVWHKGEVVFSDGFGFANLEQKVPVEPDTKMRIGSVSKTLTSAAMGKLYEEGALTVDAPVQEYVSYFPEKEHEITVSQVAGHRAGIRHYRGDEFLLDKRFDSVEESLEIFAEDTLLFEPGTDYNYSSYGWNLISAVVEEAAGEPFLQYMERAVFDPLEMDETVADYTDSLITNRTNYYSITDDGELVNAPYVDNSYKWAGGGFLGTAEDLLKFGQSIFWSDYLEPETVDLLISSQRLENGEETGYGLGWRSGTDYNGRTYYGHSGGSVGGTTQFVVFPEEETIVAMVANMGGVSYGDIHLKIADLFMESE